MSAVCRSVTGRPYHFCPCDLSANSTARRPKPAGFASASPATGTIFSACGLPGTADRFGSNPNSLGSANLPTPTISGMPTGQANRACLLNSACLRASGASPRRSAILGARSSKRAGGFITRIALDECLDPERYRTRVPFRIPEREVARAAQPFHY